MGLHVFHLLYVLLTAVTLPLYVPIIIIAVKDWKTNVQQKTINLLTISQGAADLTAIVNYLVFFILRRSHLLDSFFWRYQSYYLATWCFVQYYISDVIRALGIIFITFHRYVTICCNGSAIERWVNSRNRWILVFVHWILPFAYVIPIIGRDQLKFHDSKSMSIKPSPSLISVGNLMSFCFVLLCFFLCCLFYSRILCLLYRHRLNSRMSSQRQHGVIVQLTGLIVAFTLVMLYRLLRAVLSLNDVKLATKVLLMHPLVTGILSIVNPWMMLFTATDLRRKLCDFYGIRRNSVLSSSSLFAIKLSKLSNANTQSRVFWKKTKF